MPFNGSGVFNRIYSWVADKAAGLDISSSRMDTDSNDIASSGLGNCLTRDGQGQPTANLPMSNFRHTGVGVGIARTDYAALSQAQDGLLGWTIATGAADAITATYTPSRGAPSDGSLYSFRAIAANATTTPNFGPDGQTARTITRFGGGALQIGDIAGNLAETVLRYNASNNRYELLNPANPVNNAFVGGTAAITVPTGTTGQRPGSSAAAQMRFNSQTSAFEGFDGAAWRNFHSPAGVGPSTQSFSSGSGTYTTPGGALYLVVEMVGGGGGGGGSGSASSSGSAGGNSSLGSFSVGGGGQGVASTTANGQSGGAGGNGGGGAAVARFPGQSGGPGGNGSTVVGGPGGSSFFGGAGPSGTATINPGAAQAGTGSGGGGGGPTATPTGGGGGGGGGEYARIIIASPVATYNYSVGAAGAGGLGGGGTNGGNGAAGVVIVTAYFQ